MGYIISPLAAPLMSPILFAMLAPSPLTAAVVLLGASLAALGQDPLQGSEASRWVAPAGLPAGHNGGFLERLTTPAAGKRPHLVFVLFDDYGWADAGWHRNYTMGNVHVPATNEVQTPNLDKLVGEGINLNRNYVYKYCRCAPELAGVPVWCVTVKLRGGCCRARVRLCAGVWMIASPVCGCVYLCVLSFRRSPTRSAVQSGRNVRT